MIWSDMKRRCDQPHREQYKNYGGRGITYDPRWKQYKAFYDDMWPTYRKDLTLDRVDNDGDYCKENCQWVPSAINCRKTRKNRYYTMNIAGVPTTLSTGDWSRLYNINADTFTSRLKRGWSLEEALTSPV